MTGAMDGDVDAATIRIYYESLFLLCESQEEFRTLADKLVDALPSGGFSPYIAKVAILCEMNAGAYSTIEQLNSRSVEMGVDPSAASYLKARFYFDVSKDAVKAMEALKPILAQTSTNVSSNRLEASLLSAQCLMASGKRDKALNELLGAVKLNPYFAKTFALMAENLIAMNTQLEKARQCAERARLLQPESEAIVKSLHSVYEKLVSEKERRHEIKVEWILGCRHRDAVEQCAPIT